MPFVLWARIWSHPRTPAHALSWPATRHLYRHADAVVTYGRAREPLRGGAPRRARERVRGAAGGGRASTSRRPWRAPTGQPPGSSAAGPGAELLVLFAGRLEHEKGVRRAAGCLAEGDARAGRAAGVRRPGPARGRKWPERVKASGALGTLRHPHLPALYAAADLLVLPSVRTATFVEPWGLVVNEAMLQSTPVIASDAVGAVAGGLVRDGRNGLVFPRRGRRRRWPPGSRRWPRRRSCGLEWAPPRSRTPPHSRPPPGPRA